MEGVTLGVVYVEFLREKSWLINLVAAASALLIAASAHDLLAALAIFAAVFMFGYPIRTAYRAWGRKDDPDRWSQVVVSALPLLLGVWAVGSGLAERGFAFMAERFAWFGGDLVGFFAYLVVVSYLPRWKRERKVCPDCCEVVKHR